MVQDKLVLQEEHDEPVGTETYKSTVKSNNVRRKRRNNKNNRTARDINLNEEVETGNYHLTGARRTSILWDIAYRGFAVVVVLVLFFLLNRRVIIFIEEAFRQDVANMTGKLLMPANERLVTTHVLLAMIGATVVQTGVAVVTIISYLFPKGKS